LLLDSQDKTQDALLALVDTEEAVAAANDRGAALLRLALADSTDLFGRIIMAARFDDFVCRPVRWPHSRQEPAVC
jgi:hypothetical protein